MSISDSFRSKAVRKLDDTLSPHYVRQEDVAHALEELVRLLADRFDAEAEAIAMLGQRLDALSSAVARMQEELAELRSRR